MGCGHYDEIWSFTFGQIEEYLMRSGASWDGNAYLMEGCTVVLEKLPDHNAGSLALPRTRVMMEGVGAESFHHDFLLNFLSGGG